MHKVNIIDSLEIPANVHQCPTSKKTLYDYFFDCNQRAWIAYEWVVPKYIHNTYLHFNEMFVPTAVSVRVSQMMRQVSSIQQNSDKPTFFCSFLSWTRKNSARKARLVFGKNLSNPSCVGAKSEMFANILLRQNRKFPYLAFRQSILTQIRTELLERKSVSNDISLLLF